MLWTTTIRFASALLFVGSILATSQAFTMQMASYPPNSSNNQRTSANHHHHLSSRSSIIPGSANNVASPATSRTSNNAVATGCADYGEHHHQASLRSRVGLALGDFKRRIRRRRPNVQVIEDVSDFDAILKSTSEQFVAVFFHSPVCKACQAAAPHFDKLSQKYNNVKFLSVPLTPENKQTLQHDLGVKKFPFGHIYHSQHGLLLDELPILRKLIPRFEERLQSHVIAGSLGMALPQVTEALASEGESEGLEAECTS